VLGVVGGRGVAGRQREETRAPHCRLARGSGGRTAVGRGKGTARQPSPWSAPSALSNAPDTGSNVAPAKKSNRDARSGTSPKTPADSVPLLATRTATWATMSDRRRVSAATGSVASREAYRASNAVGDRDHTSRTP